MKRLKLLKSAISTFVIGLLISLFGFFGNIFAEADLITPGVGATKIMGISIAIGAGFIFLSAILFIFAGSFKNKE